MGAEHPQAESASIKFLSGSLQGKVFALKNAVTTIGSDPSNDIVVGDPGVASRHIGLVNGETIWRLHREPKAGPVTVDEQVAQAAVLRDRAVVRFGAATSFVVSLGAAAEAPARQPSAPERPARTPIPPRKPTGAASAPIAASAPKAPNRASVTGQLAKSASAKRGSGPNETEMAGFSLPGVAFLDVRGERGHESFALSGTTINIGRDAANDIVLDNPLVSGQHLQIVREGDDYVLIHPHPKRAKTANGLLFEGERIRGDEQFRRVLVDGDTFRIGNDQGTLVSLTYREGKEITQAVAPMQPIKLGEAVISIGRRADCKVVLPNPQVSALHALLVREGGTYRILDQNSTNGLYINSELMKDRLLELGDEIRIGPYRMVYEGNHITQFDESKFVGIEAVDLWKTSPTGAVLLNNISLCIPPRAFVALVGGSGAGKSTLMDALNGLRPAQGGHVYYNSQDFYASRASFSGQMGYVPQDDIVHKDLTVERALYFAAKLRLPSDFSDEQINQRINEVLDDVEMTPRRSLLVKKLSGGQRKRVSIALELLANPSIFFLDEPTSGLDPGLDRKMMFLLRRLADRGHTIVLVTHATNNVSVCDYVCFLAQGGRLAYFGPPDEAKEFFGTTDFAEIYASLDPTDENPEVPAEAETRFRESQAYQDYVTGPLAAAAAAAPKAPAPRAARGAQQAGAPEPVVKRRPKRSNPFKQFALITRRHVELLRNDRITLVLLLIQAPLMALLVMLLIRSSVGVGLFDTDKVVQCAPQILQTVVTTDPTSDNPSGALRLGIETGKGVDPNAPVNCLEIRKLLSGDPTSHASPQMLQLAKDYTRLKAKGNVEVALQDFIVIGSGVNTLSSLFLVAFLGVIPGCINGVREIVKEGSIYKRERAINLRIGPYVASKVAIMGAFALFQGASMLVIVELFEPFKNSIFLPALLEVFITLVLIGLSGLMAGLAISAFAVNEDSANTLLPFILIPQVVFAGVEFPLKAIPLQIVGFITPMRWAMVALGTTVGLHAEKLNGDAIFGTDTAFEGTLFSTHTQLDAIHRLLLPWGVLGGMSIALVILVYVGLKRKDIGRGDNGKSTGLSQALSTSASGIRGGTAKEARPVALR